MLAALFAPRRRFFALRPGFAATLGLGALLALSAGAAPAAMVTIDGKPALSGSQRSAQAGGRPITVIAATTPDGAQKLDSNSNPTPYYYAGYPGPPTWFWILGFGSLLGAIAIFIADASVRGMKPK